MYMHSRRSSGVAPRACARKVRVDPHIYIYMYIHRVLTRGKAGGERLRRWVLWNEEWMNQVNSGFYPCAGTAESVRVQGALQLLRKRYG